MNKIVFLFATILFLVAVGFSAAGRQHAFASHTCCNPQNCTLLNVGSTRNGLDFSVNYAYEWCHPATPLVAWIEVVSAGSQNINLDELEYNPDTYFPTHCHGAFAPVATGKTNTLAAATLVSSGKSWNATPVCSDPDSAGF
jgi:hypothetical protein